MIAKTIQRTRNIEATRRYFNEKFKTEDSCSAYQRKLFKLNTFESLRDAHSGVNIKSMSDLLTYVERTRPRTWIKDVSKSNLNIFKTLIGKSSFHNRRGSSGVLQIFQQTVAKEPAPSASTQTMHFKRSKVRFTIRDISPVRLSHQRSLSTNLQTPLIPSKPNLSIVS